MVLVPSIFLSFIGSSCRLSDVGVCFVFVPIFSALEVRVQGLGLRVTIEFRDHQTIGFRV